MDERAFVSVILSVIATMAAVLGAARLGVLSLPNGTGIVILLAALILVSAPQFVWVIGLSLVCAFVGGRWIVSAFAAGWLLLSSLGLLMLYWVSTLPLTSNLRWASAPGNVLLSVKRTGLGRDSVANVSQIVAVDRNVLTERVGRLPDADLELVLTGIDLVLGRE